jgi:hypothetical protein
VRRGLFQALFVLLTIRLLLPPGICVCQWHAPAARWLVKLLNTGKLVPPSPPVENEDDHEPGCPASKLAAGMGLRPVAHPPAPPAASSERVHVSAEAVATTSRAGIELFPAYRPPGPALYLTACALLI